MNLEALIEARRVIHNTPAREIVMHDWCGCALHHIADDRYFRDNYDFRPGFMAGSVMPRIKGTLLAGTIAAETIFEIDSDTASDLFEGFLNLPPEEAKKEWLKYIDQLIEIESYKRRQNVIDDLVEPELETVEA
jgi:hypothetical protein